MKSQTPTPSSSLIPISATTPMPTPRATTATHLVNNTGFFAPLLRLLRHRLSELRTHNALAPAALQRLGEQVTASEHRHTGQIRIVTEGSLPWSYLRRGASARERAIMLFGKHHVWDTAHNNGVLIYLLMPEHAIEIVADRGLAHRVPPEEWAALVAQMSSHFQQRDYEAGLAHATQAVTTCLVQHFPRAAGATGINELPDAPVVY